MSHIIVQAASEVVDMINGASFDTAPDSFTARRAYRPVYALETITALQVLVIAQSHTITPDSRSRNLHELGLSVAIQSPLTDPDDPGQADGLMSFAAEIIALLNRADLPQSKLRFLGIEHDPIYWPGHLRKFSLFTTAISITYQGIAS